MAPTRLAGFKLLPGPSRRYVTPSGDTISRRQYDNLRAREAGFSSRSQIERFRSSPGWAGRPWGADFIGRYGERPTWEFMADVREVEQRRAALEARYPNLSQRERDALDRNLVAANGPLARVLADTGRRPMSSYDVGAS